MNKSSIVRFGVKFFHFLWFSFSSEYDAESRVLGDVVVVTSDEVVEEGEESVHAHLGVARHTEYVEREKHSLVLLQIALNVRHDGDEEVEKDYTDDVHEDGVHEVEGRFVVDVILRRVDDVEGEEEEGVEGATDGVEVLDAALVGLVGGEDVEEVHERDVVDDHEDGETRHITDHALDTDDGCADPGQTLHEIED